MSDTNSMSESAFDGEGASTGAQLSDGGRDPKNGHRDDGIKAGAVRSIGIDGIDAPKQVCSDRNCPYHGGLSIRGKLFDGRVTGSKARKTATLQKDVPVYFAKFKRYARDKSTIHAHVPGCIDVQNGDNVLAAECRPISKSVSYVIVEVRK